MQSLKARALRAQLCDLKRVPETVPADVAKSLVLQNSIRKLRVATIDELANYDAIIIGAPTLRRTDVFADGRRSQHEPAPGGG